MTYTTPKVLIDFLDKILNDNFPVLPDFVIKGIFYEYARGELIECIKNGIEKGNRLKIQNEKDGWEITEDDFEGYYSVDLVKSMTFLVTLNSTSKLCSEQISNLTYFIPKEIRDLL